jgi:hypothetical protein
MSETPDHLGGHSNKTWEDEGALKYLIEEIGLKTMIDVGCGPGGQVDTAKELGIDAIGIDGDPSVEADVTHDFTVGPPDIDKKFDLAWSVEFLEHVAEDYMDNYFSLFEKSRYVVCTASPQEGDYHFNVKPREWWLEQFEKRGFKYRQDLLDNVLQHSTMKRKRLKHKTTRQLLGTFTWLEQTGMVFENTNYE